MGRGGEKIRVIILIIRGGEPGVFLKED